MVSTLGWLNVILLILVAQIYTLKKIMIAISASESKKIKDTITVVPWRKVYKFWRMLHPFMGLLTLVIGSYHGYLALGGLRLHTGSLVLTNLFLLAIVGGILFKSISFKNRMRFIHRSLALLLIATFLIHYFWPALIPPSL